MREKDYQLYMVITNETIYGSRCKIARVFVPSTDAWTSYTIIGTHYSYVCMCV